MDIITEHKFILSAFFILVFLFFVIILSWKMQDNAQFERARTIKDYNDQDELKKYINSILKDHTNQINFITAVLIENNVDNATLEILHRRLKDEDLKTIGFSEEKIRLANQYSGKLSIKDLQIQS